MINIHAIDNDRSTRICHGQRNECNSIATFDGFIQTNLSKPTQNKILKEKEQWKRSTNWHIERITLIIHFNIIQDSAKGTRYQKKGTLSKNSNTSMQPSMSAFLNSVALIALIDGYSSHQSGSAFLLFYGLNN